MISLDRAEELTAFLEAMAECAESAVALTSLETGLLGLARRIVNDATASDKEAIRRAWREALKLDAEVTSGRAAHLS